MATLYKVLTVLSLVGGGVLLLPWMGVLIANIMALAGIDASQGSDPAKQAVVLLFIVASTLWPLSWLASLGLSIAAWVADRPGLALLGSLVWLVWALVCVMFFAVWAAVD